MAEVIRMIWTKQKPTHVLHALGVTKGKRPSRGGAWMWIGLSAGS